MSKTGLDAPNRERTRGTGFFIPGKNGGASRDRTDDLKLAKLALSQLSYGPIGSKPLAMVGRVGVEPTTSRLSGVRSNHLSYRPPPCAEGVGGQARLAVRRLVRHSSGAATADFPG